MTDKGSVRFGRKFELDLEIAYVKFKRMELKNSNSPFQGRLVICPRSLMQKKGY